MYRNISKSSNNSNILTSYITEVDGFFLVKFGDGKFVKFQKRNN